MTAEIAISNREAVALAADSAVTITGPEGQKIFTSANKIFALSETHPVGIMIYGDAEILRVPWQTIIKMYRADRADTSFATLEEYARDFLKFLADPPHRFFPPDAQEDHAAGVMLAYAESLLDAIEERAIAYLDDHDRINEVQLRTMRDAVIRDAAKRAETGHPIDGAPADYLDQLRSRYSDVADSVIKAVFQGLRPQRGGQAMLRDLLLKMLGSLHPTDDPPPIETGVVVAGFGEDDIFPDLQAYSTEGMAADVLKQHPWIGARITSMGLGASVFPFAQREMVERFMEAVDGEYQMIVESEFHDLITSYPDRILSQIDGLSESERKRLSRRLTKKAHEDFVEIRAHLDALRQSEYIDPVMELADALPKEDLAAMAEALVNLTSLKRRFSPDPETVGGPIDVAVISKGDGFVWIRRKHYFPPELNPRYFARTHGGRRDAET